MAKAAQEANSASKAEIPIGVGVVFGKFENLDLAWIRGDELTNQLKGKGYGITASILDPTVGVNIPADSLGKEGNPYAKEFG